MNIAIIPARYGSRRIPHKNRRYFHGKPIIAYSIEAAKAADLFSLILVSTDDDEVAKIAKNYGAQVHRRPPDLARDEVGTYDVTRAVTLELLATLAERKVDWANPGERIDHVCCIYATAPMISPLDIRAGLLTLKLMGAPHAVSVGKWISDAAQFYWSTVVALRANVPYSTAGTVIVPIEERRVCDINVEEDFVRAERMYAAIKAGTNP